MHNKRNVIGICTAELDQKWHAKLMETLTREFIRRGYYTMIFSCDVDCYLNRDTDMGAASIFTLPNLDNVDAMVVFCETIRNKKVRDELIGRLKEADVHVILVDEESEGCYSVLYDQNTAFEKLVRHVIEYHNLKEVNFLSGPEGNSVAEERLAIYKKVLEENDIPIDEERIGYGDFWELPARKAMEEFMAEDKVPPEAIICANDTMAVTACDYLRSKGYKVPEDIIVTGLDGIEEGIYHNPGITTCVRDEVNDAKRMADIVQNLLDGKTVPYVTEIPYHIRLSGSCGCQMDNLFDFDRVIQSMKLSYAYMRSQIRECKDMAEEILQCRTQEEFEEIIESYMKEDSFLCLNENFSIEEKEPKSVYEDGVFTSEMKAFVRLNGKTFEDDCFSINVVPESGKDTDPGKAVLIYPLHFEKEVVGYIGFWRDPSELAEAESLLQYICNLNLSLSYRLAAAPEAE